MLCHVQTLKSNEVTLFPQIGYRFEANKQFSVCWRWSSVEIQYGGGGWMAVSWWFISLESYTYLDLKASNLANRKRKWNSTTYFELTNKINRKPLLVCKTQNKKGPLSLDKNMSSSSLQKIPRLVSINYTTHYSRHHSFTVQEVFGRRTNGISCISVYLNRA